MFYSIIILTIAFLGYVKWNNYSVTDVGLVILTKIKAMKGEAIDLTIFEKEESTVITHEGWTELVSQHVSPSGKVDYKGFIKDKERLNNYLDTLSNYFPAKNWTEAEQMTYWINAYNAFTVKLIIDYYPLKSIKDIGGNLPMINSPWDIKFFKIGGVDFDLNTIEHEILRKQFEEPRIHFAINCASFSCPKLRNEAFEAEKLEEQLEEQTIYFINNVSKNEVSKKGTKLSQIFSWFESDFKKKMPVTSYLKKYHSDFNEKNEVAYLEYNWTLNE
jgi:hypothetical protein